MQQRVAVMPHGVKGGSKNTITSSVAVMLAVVVVEVR
jgi:hypothetical protein